MSEEEEAVAVLSPQYSVTTNHTSNMWCSLTVSSISTAGVWSCPVTTGERPPPCHGLTFTSVDDRRAVAFGGYNGEQGDMNDVYIIDLSTMVHVIVSMCRSCYLSMISHVVM